MAKAEDITVKSLVMQDLPAVTETHILAFPDNGITKLGTEAVRRYYEWQLTGPHEVFAIGATLGESNVGFCFGGMFRGAVSGFLRKNRNYLAWRVLTHPWLATSSVFRERLKTGMRVIKLDAAPRRETGSLPSSAAKSFGILAIAVNPQYQGYGIGKILMKDSEQHARRHGFGEMHLTVRVDNQQATAFYEKLNWQKVLINGTWEGKMKKILQ